MIKKITKLEILIGISIIFIFAISSSTFAAGYNHSYGEHIPSQDMPHGIYLSNANNCKTCHAAHGANSNSYRLLRATARDDECDYCHASGGVSDKIIEGGAHGVHLTSDRGPKIYCYNCHATHPSQSSAPEFRDWKTIAQTDVCNICHSNGGSYNGVNSTGDSVGAKNNWWADPAENVSYPTESQIYNIDNTLKAGKEKWCAGCHDEVPSEIDTISAPAVIGDESGDYNYGKGWGFYKTGHGLASSKSYPSSGGLQMGAGKNCPDCHDLSLSHIDGNHRTYSASSNNYRTGYRLKQVDLGGGPINPMEIPLPQSNDTFHVESFALCASCHNTGPFLDSNNHNTNFYYGNANRHYYHLNSRNLAFKYDSDWDGVYDSEMSCPNCHNVHGSKNLAMINDGSLANNPSPPPHGIKGLRIWYGNSSSTYSSYNDPEPTGLTLVQSTGLIWVQSSVINICGSCHAMDLTSGATRSQSVYWNHENPVIDWTMEPYYQNRGIRTDRIFNVTENEPFRIKYFNKNNTAPTTIQLWINLNDQNSYNDPGEKITMTEDDPLDTTYTDGKIYKANATITQPTDKNITYRIYANDGTYDATGVPTEDQTIEWDNNFMRDVPSEYPTIQAAIDASYDGNTISVDPDSDPGTPSIDPYSESIDYSGKELNIISTAGAGSTTIAGSGAYVACVTFSGNTSSTLDGFTVDNIALASGATRGVYIGTGATPTISNCNITDNDAHSTTSGAGIYITGGGLTLENTDVTYNTTQSAGSGLYVENTSLPITITNSNIDNNTGASGTGAYFNSCTGTIDITGTSVSNNNSPTGSGSGIWSNSSMTLTSCTIDGNTVSHSPDQGGGIYFNGAGKTLTLINTEVNGNSSHGAGGVYFSGAQLNITGGAISGNTVPSQHDAGGLYAAGPATIYGTYIQGNQCGYSGGGIFTSSTLTITNATITGNAAGAYTFAGGGGINSMTSGLTVINCTVSGNRTQKDGGGINGGGGTVKNSIVWGNTVVTGSGPNVNNATVSYSDLSGTGWTDGGGNINSDPQFIDPRTAAQAPTTAGNYHLLGTSPCLNLATSTGAPSDDIDGDSRPLYGGYDMGSDEYTPPPSAPTIGTPAALSSTSIRWNFTDNANNEIGFKAHDSAHIVMVSSATPNLSYLDETALSPNTQYTRHVHAYNGGGDSAGSADASIYTLADAPTLPVASDSYANKINVSWTAPVTGANHYHVYRDGIAGTGTLVYNSTATSFDDTITGSHTYYIYSVNADNVNSASYISDTGKTEVPPSAPTIGTPAALTSTSIRWNFTDNANNEDGFKVHDSAHTVMVSSATPNLSYLDETALSPNTQYTRHVHAYNAAGDSLGSADAIIYTLADAPTLPVATDGTYSNKINVSWTAPVTGASSYKVYRDGVAGVGTLVYNSTATSFDDMITGLHTYYIYSVNADNVNSASYISDDGYAGIPNAPTIGTPAALSSTSIRWNFTDNANNEDGFKVHDSAHTVKVSSATINLSYLDETALSPNTQYTRHVHAYNAVGDSAGSADATLYTLPNVPASISATASSTSQIGVSWSPGAGGADHYHVRSSSDGYLTIKYDGPLTAYNETLLSTNTQYTYRVYAVNADNNESGTYATVSKYTLSNDPTGASASDGTYSDRIAVSWTSGGSQSGYRVFRDGDKDTGTQVYDGVVTSFDDIITGSHTYYVYSKNGDNVLSNGYSSDFGYTIGVPIQPTIGTPAALSSTSIRWNFTDNANDEVGFKVHDSAHSIMVSSPTPDLSYLDETALSPNTQYTRHVHAYNAAGDSLGSADATIYTLANAPTNPVATDGAYNDRINVSWTASASASSYRVYRDGVAGVGTLVYNLGGTSFDDMVTGIHTYYIYSVNGDNVNSANYIFDGGYTATGNVLNVPSQYGTIQAAINASTNGDTVLVANGIYSENINFNNKAVTVISQNGAANTTIQGLNISTNLPVVTFSSGEGAGSILDGFTINNQVTTSNLTRGISISANSSPTINNCIIEGNNITFTYGAGINLTGAGATITGTTIRNNTSNQRTGGIYCDSSHISLTNCTIDNNSTTVPASYSGGGIYLNGASSYATISGGSITNNVGQMGAGIYVNGSTAVTPLSISGGTTISGNHGPNSGAGIYLTLVTNRSYIDNATISGNYNTSGNGGGIYCDSPLTITNSTISSNTSNTGAGQRGGGLYLTGVNANIIITNTIISGNICKSTGGGVSATSGANITINSGSIIEGNTTTTANGGGIGIDVVSSIINISKTKIRGNRANQNGGGLWVSSASANSTNSTISGNITDLYDGGGIYNGGTLTVMNSSVAGNFARYGGGLNGGGTVTNSIFWGNNATTGPQINGAPTVSYSDVGQTGYPSGTSINADPLFVLLVQASSGSPTTAGDYHIPSGSPCTNVGTSTGAPADDIDNQARPYPSGGNYDMGSDEYMP